MSEVLRTEAVDDGTAGTPSVTQSLTTVQTLNRLLLLIRILSYVLLLPHKTHFRPINNEIKVSLCYKTVLSNPNVVQT